MINLISHQWEDESPEAKARWFQSLSVYQRMELFTSYTNLILEVNPSLLETKDARPVTDRVRILTKE